MNDGATVGSLFSGIGGLDLGLERAGWTVRWQVEIDPFCRRVLAKHWPDVRRYEDVRAFPEPDTEPVDLLCGGFPCQPVSVAGKQLAQADPRWLWPEFARIIRVLRPSLVLLENVPGLLHWGFGDVLGDLASCGYDAEWDCLPASAVGAPHQRDRVWIVASRVGNANMRDLGWDNGVGIARSAGSQARGEDVADASLDGRGSRWSGGRESRRSRLGSDEVANADGDGLEGTEHEVSREGASIFGRRPSDSGWWATEPDVGRVAHGIPARVDRLRGLGNAVVPQVSEWIGRRLIGW